MAALLSHVPAPVVAVHLEMCDLDLELLPGIWTVQGALRLVAGSEGGAGYSN